VPVTPTAVPQSQAFGTHFGDGAIPGYPAGDQVKLDDIRSVKLTTAVPWVDLPEAVHFPGTLFLYGVQITHLSYPENLPDYWDKLYALSRSTITVPIVQKVRR
jgi:hypothetical protein